MPRTRSADILPKLVSAAAETFIAQGFQRTQMQDVADALGVAKGTVYGYVENKGALLGAALRFADGVEHMPEVADLPVRAPAEGELAAMVAERLRGEVEQLRLVEALSKRRHGPLAVELGEIITNLYDTLSRHRVSIKLVDRCAPELPELADVWFGQGRSGLVVVLTEYLQRRKALRLPGPAPLVARTILETCVLWAVHLHWDSARQEPQDTAAVPSTLAGLLTRGLLPEGGST